MVDATETAPRSGLAKRLIEAAEALFVRQDVESALHPLCSAIDRVAADTCGKPGKGSYKQFVHERMEMITRVAFGGTAVLNLHFSRLAIRDEHGNLVKADKQNETGEPLYSFQQVLYHVVRCGLAHDCEIGAVVGDSGDEGARITHDGERLMLPLRTIAVGLLTTVLTEVDLADELKGSIFEHVAWKTVPLIELVNRKDRVLALARGEGAS